MTTPHLLDHVRATIRFRHYSLATESSHHLLEMHRYVQYLLVNGKMFVASHASTLIPSRTEFAHEPSELRDARGVYPCTPSQAQSTLNRIITQCQHRVLPSP